MGVAARAESGGGVQQGFGAAGMRPPAIAAMFGSLPGRKNSLHCGLREVGHGY
jgi:hypothetical protein